MTKISTHLRLKEVTKSGTAIRLDIDNNPTPEHLENLKQVAAQMFEPLRNHFNVPIGVNSGYRSAALNKAVGGSSSSQHCKGEALDLDADVYGDLTNAEIFKFIEENLDFDQLIWEKGNDEEPAWVHVSYVTHRKNRGKKLRYWGKGKYTTLK